jgi:hypothetical protein
MSPGLRLQRRQQLICDFEGCDLHDVGAKGWWAVISVSIQRLRTRPGVSQSLQSLRNEERRESSGLQGGAGVPKGGNGG